MSSGVRIDWTGRDRATVPRSGPRWRVLEAFGPRRTAPWFCRADNLPAMAGLLGDWAGRVDLVYLDPPFGTGRTFPKAGGGPAYRDRFAGGIAGLLSMLEPRLRLVADLLAPTGSLYVHLDAIAVHPVKLLLDEIFGPACFQREIVWRIGWISGFKSAQRNWVRNHDTILFYTKDPRRFTFNKIYVPHRPGYRRRGGGRTNARGVPAGDVWNAGPEDLALSGSASLDSIQIKSLSREKTGFATQKNESLLERIVRASSNEGDLVLDPFCGSGTTLAVAARLGRRAIGIDDAPAAADVVRRRLAADPACGLVIAAAGETPAFGEDRPRVRAAGVGPSTVRLSVTAARRAAGEGPVPARWTGIAAGVRDRRGVFVARAAAFRPLPDGPLDGRLGPVAVPIRDGRGAIEVRVYGRAGAVSARTLRFERRDGVLRRLRDR